MGVTKDKLRAGETALGGWTMTGHPAVAEIMAGEGFDFVTADLEHTAIGLAGLEQLALAVKDTGCDLLARLPSCDPTLAKQALDVGATGIIVPSVNTPAEAAQSAAMARFPPEGTRGVSLCRATGYGRRFTEYLERHNRDVVVVVMLEHIAAARQAEAILATPGIDAAFIGPYDLSASLGLAGQLAHSAVQSAQEQILTACRQRGVAPGIHVVSADPLDVRRRMAEGYRFIACGIDTLFIREGSRRMLAAPEA